jgi:hypothetical protein
VILVHERVSQQSVLFGIAIIALGGLTIGFVPRIVERSLRRRRLNDRPEHPPDAVFDERYRKLGISVDEFRAIWERFGHLLHVDAAKLRPEDRLEDLAMSTSWKRGSPTSGGGEVEHDHERSNRWMISCRRVPSASIGPHLDWDIKEASAPPGSPSRSSGRNVRARGARAGARGP